MNINHVALWTDDLESLKDFYGRWFGAVAGDRYHNPRKDFTSYFLTFPDGGAAIEVMRVPGTVGRDTAATIRGFCHIAVSLGSKESVDRLTERMRRAGVPVLGEPRTTGDGCYESVIADPDGNPVELTV